MTPTVGALHPFRATRPRPASGIVADMGRAIIGVLAAVLCAGALVSGCGGSSSSTPSYCKDRSNLESSVKGLTSVDLKSGGTSALKAQLEKVQSDAKALVSSAKSDFPSQTDAISASVTSLETSAKQLPSSPSVGQVAAVAAGASSVATALKGFTDATSSKC
jgi:hypothetical protein